MADIEELRQMVCTFRVSELQVLLGFAGRNKSGRKQELMTRALQLIHRGCAVPIQIKIKELHRRRFPTRQNNTASSIPDVKTPPRAAPEKPSPRPVHGTELGNSLGGILESPVDVKNNMHNQLPVYPDVRFKSLPFYDSLGELLKPTSLVPRGTARYQETFYMFYLTPQQAQDIAMSREFQPGSRVDYSVQVQLRFCLLETSCDQQDTFPSSICVRVNGKIATLPPPIPTNKPGVEPKRPGRPVNITNLCRISPTTPNHISVSWAAEFAKGFCLTVNLVRKLNSDTLLKRLQNKGIRHPDHSRAMIKEKLSHDPDNEIATTSLRVSLRCPLGKMRMQIPARALCCTHLQCFDALTYLMMNERKPTWICPVCDKSCPYLQLNIDGLFVEILKHASVDDIKFHEDGTWSPLEEKKSKNIERATVSTSVLDESVTIIDADDEGGCSNEGQKRRSEVIDLTLSSSEDEDSDDDDDDNDVTDKNDSSMDKTLSPSSPMVPSKSTSCASISPVRSVSPMVMETKPEPMSKDYRAPNLSRLIENGLDDPPGWPSSRMSSAMPPLAHMPPSQSLMARYSAPSLPDLDIFNLDFETSREDMFRNFLDPSVSSHSRSTISNRPTSFANALPFSYTASSSSSMPLLSRPFPIWPQADDSPGSDVIPLD